MFEGINLSDTENESRGKFGKEAQVLQTTRHFAFLRFCVFCF